MAGERSGVTSVVQNESPLAYYFHCAKHCINLSACAAVKVSAIQNAENVAQEWLKCLDQREENSVVEILHETRYL